MARKQQPTQISYTSSDIMPDTGEVIGDIPGIVECAGNLYAKSPEALDKLLKALRDYGYDIKDCGQDGDRPPREKQEREGWYLWWAHLSDNAMQRRGKCDSCNSYIDTRGIQSHGHKCEVCGEVTFWEYIDGTTVKFVFLADDNSAFFSPKMRMVVKAYDEATESIILYPTPEIGGGWSDYATVEDAQAALDRNSHAWSEVEIDGETYISIRYPHQFNRNEAVIEMYEVWGHKGNHKIVKLFKGVEYSEYDRLPVRESYSIYEAWHWMPLHPSPFIHEKILSGGGLISDMSWYYQDGRQAVYEGNLKSMRRYVEHFTLYDLDAWDRMIARAPLSGPGMIRAVANFCHETPIIENRGNIGNLLVLLGNEIEGKGSTPSEVAAAEAVFEDPESREMGMFLMRGIFGEDLPDIVPDDEY